MKRITYKDSWPEIWKQKYSYDLLEIYGEITNRGYAYAYKNRLDLTLAMVKAVAPRNTRVLDVAAGSGNFSLSLAETGYKVVWNDLMEDLVEYVKQKYEYGEITYAPGNVIDLKFEQPFDLVLIAEIIEHVAYPNVFLQKIAQLVAPGGHIVMTTPNGHYFRNQLPRFSDFKDPSVFEQSQFGPGAEDHIFALYLDEIENFKKDYLNCLKTHKISKPKRIDVIYNKVRF